MLIKCFIMIKSVTFHCGKACFQASGKMNNLAVKSDLLLRKQECVLLNASYSQSRKGIK